MGNVAVVSRIAHRSAKHAKRPGPIRWWDALPEDFAHRDEGFDLAWKDRSAVTLTAASDVVMRTVGAGLVGGLAFPLGYHPLELRRALKDADFYGPIAESGDPDRFFAAPPRVEFTRKPAKRPLFSPEDCVCEDLSFESPFVPNNERIRASYLAHGENRTAHARYWRHKKRGPRPTVIAVHGFSADLYHLNEWFFALPTLYRLGADVLLFTLPFHGQRQTRLSPFSGHGFFAGGPSRINEAFAQAVFDLRICVDWLLGSGSPEVGITGVSLGGYTAALFASVEPRLAFSVPNVPGDFVARPGPGMGANRHRDPLVAQVVREVDPRCTAPIGTVHPRSLTHHC